MDSSQALSGWHFKCCGVHDPLFCQFWLVFTPSLSLLVNFVLCNPQICKLASQSYTTTPASARCKNKPRSVNLLTAFPPIQSSSEMLLSIIRDLRDMDEMQDTRLITQSKILVISSNVPTRLFNQWSFRVLNLPASRLLEEYETSEPIEKLVSLWD